LLGYLSIRAIENLEPATKGCQVIEIKPSPDYSQEVLNSITCNTYLLAKAKAVISRRKDKHREVLPEAENAKIAVCL